MELNYIGHRTLPTSLGARWEMGSSCTNAKPGTCRKSCDPKAPKSAILVHAPVQSQVTALRTCT